MNSSLHFILSLAHLLSDEQLLTRVTHFTIVRVVEGLHEVIPLETDQRSPA